MKIQIEKATPILKCLSLVVIFMCAFNVNHINGQTTAESTGYIDANGIDYYYEIRGEGKPLLLLHGGLGNLDMFQPVLPAITTERQVIMVDLHGHGRTELGDREINLIDIGNDLAVILKALNYDQLDVMGYSFGAGAAFRLAVQHPQMVSRLVLVSAGFARDGFFPDILAQQSMVNASAAEMMKETPMYKSYVEVAPNPDDFPNLLDNMGSLMAEDYDWSADVKKLNMPVMIIFGDSDMYRPEHMIEFYKLLGGGQRDPGWTGEHMSKNRLAILPGLTHYNIVGSPVMVNTALNFLNQKK